MVAAKATLKLCIVGRLSVHVMPLENWLIDVIYVIRFQKQFSRDGPIKRLFHLYKPLEKGFSSKFGKRR